MNDGLAAMEGMTTQEIAERSAATCCRCHGSSRRTSPPRWSAWPATGARYVTGTTLVIDAGLLTR